MSSPKPKTKRKEVFDLHLKIIDAVNNGKSVLPIEWARARKGAEELQKVSSDRGLATAILARLCAVEIDRKGLDAWIQYGLRSLNGDAEFLFNVADAAAWVGDFDSAFKLLRQSELAGYNIAQPTVLNILVRMGCYRQASEMMRICLPEDEQNSWDVHSFVAASEMMNALGISDEELSSRVSVAIHLIAEHTKRPVQLFTLIDVDDGLIYRAPGFGSVEEAADLEERIAFELNSKFDDSLSRLISFAVSPGSGEQREVMTLGAGVE